MSRAPVTLDTMATADSVARPRWTRATFVAASALLRARGIRIVTRGLFELPTAPVLFAMNHTHHHDFLPLRHMLYRHGQHAVTWIKPRAYAHPAQRFFLSRTGNIPLPSRGYVIAADFARTMGRRPTDAEYALLRAHVDSDLPLSGPVAFTPLSVPRSILGHSASAWRRDYRTTIHDVFARLMQHTLRLARRAIARGHHMHVYPQGTVSPRLGPGRPGVIHAALALGLPIVPVGASGIPAAFASRRRPGATITLRFGRPYHVPPLRGLVPFQAASSHAAIIEHHTTDLMHRIATLVGPAHRPADSPMDLARRQPVARFL